MAKSVKGKNESSQSAPKPTKETSKKASPKSKVKKTTGGAKKGKEEDDLGVDDEFKDMDLFNDRGFDDDDDDF